MALAALASVLNFASLASKSALFSQIAGSAAVSPPVLEVSGHRFLALSWVSPKVAEHLLGRLDVERLLAFDHLARDAGLIAILLHHRLAGGDRIALGDHGGDAERSKRGGENETLHH